MQILDDIVDAEKSAEVLTQADKDMILSKGLPFLWCVYWVKYFSTASIEYYVHQNDLYQDHNCSHMLSETKVSVLQKQLPLATCHKSGCTRDNWNYVWYGWRPNVGIYDGTKPKINSVSWI